MASIGIEKLPTSKFKFSLGVVLCFLFGHKYKAVEIGKGVTEGGFDFVWSYKLCERCGKDHYSEGPSPIKPLG